MLAALVAMRQRLPGLAAEKLPKFGVESMWVYHPLVSRRLARITKLAGVELIAWTVDDLARMQRLVDAGVNGLVSNDPRLFAALPGYSLRSRRRIRSVPTRKSAADQAASTSPPATWPRPLVAFRQAVQRADRLRREVVADVAGEQFRQRREDEEEGERGDDRADLVADDRADAEAEGAEQGEGGDDAGVDRDDVAGRGQARLSRSEKRGSARPPLTAT